MNVLDIAKNINKAWKNETITSGDVLPECNRFSMGTLSADYALYGGLPEGKLVVYAGEPGSCKSLLACLAMAQYQKAHPDKTCIYVDAEETLIGQIDWFGKMTGLNYKDPNQFVRYDCSGKSAEEIFDDIVELQKADNIGMIIIDSAPMLLSQADIDNPIAKDNGQRASIAKSMGKFLKFMVPAIARAGNPLLIINHTRVAGTTFTGAAIYKEPGGDAPRYYASVKVRFGKRVFMKDGDEIKGDDGEGADGFRLKFKITKNKTCACNRGGGFITYKYETGADTVNDLIDVALQFDFIKRVNNVTYELVNLSTGEVITDSETGETLRGKKSYLIDYLHTHDTFREKYLAMIKEFISASNDKSVLDKEALRAIEEEEDAIERPQEDAAKRKVLLEDA